MLKNLTFRVLSRLHRSKCYHTLSLHKSNLNSRHLLKKYDLLPSVRLVSTETPARSEPPEVSQESDPTEELSEVDILSIAEGDTEVEKMLKIIILEVDIFRQDGQLVPDHIELDEWKELLELKSRSSRLRYLTFLFKNERKRENKRRKIDERKQERLEGIKAAEESGHIKYGFGGNTIFLRIYTQTMDFYLNQGLMNAALYSQHLVIDCSYDCHMNHFEARNCARQLCLVFSENRYHPQPFHLQFCNLDPEAYMTQVLHRYMPPMYEPSYPFFATQKSYLDLYPKERLVYLTPHCRNDLTEFNHDDIYIVGAMVDKMNPKPLSLAKAKEEGLRMARLPLEQHVVWGSGSSKSLTLNQMMSIMLDRRHTGSWKEAFKHIPRRKLVTPEELAQEPEHGFRKPRAPIERRTNDQREVHVSSEILKKIRPKKFDVSKLYD